MNYNISLVEFINFRLIFEGFIFYESPSFCSSHNLFCLELHLSLLFFCFTGRAEIVSTTKGKVTNVRLPGLRRGIMLSHSSYE